MGEKMNAPIADRNFCNSVVLLMEIDRLARSTLYFSVIVVTFLLSSAPVCNNSSTTRYLSMSILTLRFFFFFLPFEKSRILEEMMKIFKFFAFRLNIIFYFVNNLAIVKPSRQFFFLEPVIIILMLNWPRRE